MNADRALVQAVILGINDARVLYPCCIRCYAKMLHHVQSNIWHCVRCDVQCQEKELSWRYRLSLRIADTSASSNISLFGGTLVQHFGCGANQFHKVLEGQGEIEGKVTDDLLLQALDEAFVGNTCIFCLKIDNSNSSASTTLHNTCADTTANGSITVLTRTSTLYDNTAVAGDDAATSTSTASTTNTASTTMQGNSTLHLPKSTCLANLLSAQAGRCCKRAENGRLSVSDFIAVQMISISHPGQDWQCTTVVDVLQRLLHAPQSCSYSTANKSGKERVSGDNSVVPNDARRRSKRIETLKRKKLFPAQTEHCSVVSSATAESEGDLTNKVGYSDGERLFTSALTSRSSSKQDKRPSCAGFTSLNLETSAEISGGEKSVMSSWSASECSQQWADSQASAVFSCQSSMERAFAQSLTPSQGQSQALCSQTQTQSQTSLANTSLESNGSSVKRKKRNSSLWTGLGSPSNFKDQCQPLSNSKAKCDSRRKSGRIKGSSANPRLRSGDKLGVTNKNSKIEVVGGEPLDNDEIKDDIWEQFMNSFETSTNSLNRTLQAPDSPVKVSMTDMQATKTTADNTVDPALLTSAHEHDAVSVSREVFRNSGPTACQGGHTLPSLNMSAGDYSKFMDDSWGEDSQIGDKSSCLLAPLPQLRRETAGQVEVGVSISNHKEEDNIGRWASLDCAEKATQFNPLLQPGLLDLTNTSRITMPDSEELSLLLEGMVTETEEAKDDETEKSPDSAKKLLRKGDDEKMRIVAQVLPQGIQNRTFRFVESKWSKSSRRKTMVVCDPSSIVDLGCSEHPSPSSTVNLHMPSTSISVLPDSENLNDFLNIFVEHPSDVRLGESYPDASDSVDKRGNLACKDKVELEQCICGSLQQDDSLEEMQVNCESNVQQNCQEEGLLESAGTCVLDTAVLAQAHEAVRSTLQWYIPELSTITEVTNSGSSSSATSVAGCAESIRLKDLSVSYGDGRVLPTSQINSGSVSSRTVDNKAPTWIGQMREKSTEMGYKSNVDHCIDGSSYSATVSGNDNTTDVAALSSDKVYAENGVCVVSDIDTVADSFLDGSAELFSSSSSEEKEVVRVFRSLSEAPTAHKSHLSSSMKETTGSGSALQHLKRSRHSSPAGETLKKKVRFSRRSRVSSVMAMDERLHQSPQSAGSPVFSQSSFVHTNFPLTGGSILKPCLRQRLDSVWHCRAESNKSLPYERIKVRALLPLNTASEENKDAFSAEMSKQATLQLKTPPQGKRLECEVTPQQLSESLFSDDDSPCRVEVSKSHQQCLSTPVKGHSSTWRSSRSDVISVCRTARSAQLACGTPTDFVSGSVQAERREKSRSVKPTHHVDSPESLIGPAVIVQPATLISASMSHYKSIFGRGNTQCENTQPDSPSPSHNAGSQELFSPASQNNTRLGEQQTSALLAGQGTTNNEVRGKIRLDCRSEEKENYVSYSQKGNASFTDNQLDCNVANSDAHGDISVQSPSLFDCSESLLSNDCQGDEVILNTCLHPFHVDNFAAVSTPIAREVTNASKSIFWQRRVSDGLGDLSDVTDSSSAHSNVTVRRSARLRELSVITFNNAFSPDLFSSPYS